MPLKIQTYRKVTERLVPLQCAMARSRLPGAIMIIAWSAICNHNCIFPEVFFVILSFHLIFGIGCWWDLQFTIRTLWC